MAREGNINKPTQLLPHVSGVPITSERGIKRPKGWQCYLPLHYAFLAATWCNRLVLKFTTDWIFPTAVGSRIPVLRVPDADDDEIFNSSSSTDSFLLLSSFCHITVTFCVPFLLSFVYAVRRKIVYLLCGAIFIVG